ncbi:MAG: RdgB/HAM1 family non-canonical purine NTP pyrophosphatase [Ferruginibacter sp.]
MQSFIFATNNKNKVDEIRSVLNDRFQIISLKEGGIDIDIPEPHDTLEKNALEKSNTIYQLTGKDCFSEDTGLEVEALNGEPGVKSARYAGDESDPQKNIKKLLTNLKGQENRKARFRTVISLIIQGKEYLFDGICTGKIIEEEIGANGFGYDAIFIPDGSSKSFGEMTMEEKNKYSHRKKATKKLIDFLKKYDG